MTEAEELELLQLQAQSGQPMQEVSPWDVAQEAPDTIQEQHPEFSWKDRLITKNLSSSPESTLAYLKKEHPNLDIQLDPASGQIKAKSLGETTYRVLDPDTGVTGGLGELIADVGDVGYDVASGIGQGIATAAGGVAGAAGGLGVGAIPGAIGAGAASGVGLEGLRQGAGSLFGIENNIDPTQIGVAGLAGALSPALMGTGATAANVAGKGFAGKLAKIASPTARETLERGLSEAGATAALQAQKGLPSRLAGKMVEKYLPSAASKIAGVTKGDVDDLAKHTKIVQNFEKNPESIETAISSTVEDAGNKFRTTLTDLQNQIEDKLEKEVGDKINISAALEPWEQKLKELATAAQVQNATPADIQAYEGFRDTFQTVFGKQKLIGSTKPGVLPIRDPKFLTRTPKQVRTIQENISELANWDKGLRVQSGAAELNPAERVINLTAKGSYDLMNKALPESVRALKTKQAELIKHREFLQSVINTPKKFISTMNQASQDKLQNKVLNSQLKEIDNLIGSNLDSSRGAVNAATKFGTDVGWFDLKKRGPSAVLGGIVGYAANRAGQGQGEGFNLPGVTAGAALGGVLGGPRAVRALLEAARRGGTGKYMAPASQFVAKPVWNLMMDKGEK